MRVAAMNWMQVEAYLQRDDRAVLPLGSTEQHSYLRLTVDCILPEQVAAEAAEPLGISTDLWAALRAFDGPGIGAPAAAGGGGAALAELVVVAEALGREPPAFPEDAGVTRMAAAPGELGRDELMLEAAAVLCGTMLMASGTSGNGPDSHDSSTTLSTLLPRKRISGRASGTALRFST